MTEPGEEGATDAPEDKITARERRAQRVKAAERKALPKKTIKNVGIALIIVLLIVGAVGAYRLIPKGPGTGHIHTGFKMYVESEEISFSSPFFDLSNTGYARGHLHVGESYTYVLHIEGELGLGLGRFFESIQVDMDPDRIRLDETVHGGRDVRNNETHSWKLWVDTCGDGPDNWHEEPKFNRFAPIAHDRMLIVYERSNATVDDLRARLDSVPSDEEIASVGKDACDG